MNYMLLMYHPDSYWSEQTPERDVAEEHAFAEFCQWMREEGITWDSAALMPPEPAPTRTFTMKGSIHLMLPEVTDVITGYFLLNVPREELAEAILDRCPHIDGTRLELRKLAS